jgi:outer membrane murein-binding lipoprotein Lpp
MSQHDHPTPVQGEALPVVAYVVEGGYVTMGCHANPGERLLTDHAQATAEIARLQGEVDALKEKLTKQNIILGMTKLSVADKDRAIDQLRTQLSDATGQVGKLTQAWNAACAFIDSHAGDPDMTEEMCRTYAAFVDIRTALNSTAPK